LNLIGPILQQERLRQNISLEQIEADTKIRKAYLVVLETDDYARLPPKVYAVGFLKQYCNYLKLPLDTQDELIDAFKAAAFSEDDHLAEREAEKKPKKRGYYGQRRINPWAAVCVVVFLVLGAMTLKYLGNRPDGGTDPNTPAVTQQDIPAETDQTPDTVTETMPTVYTTVKVQITVKPQQRCWMSVTVDGAPAYTGTLSENDAPEFIGRESVRIRAGNAGALELMVNDVAIMDLGEQVVEREFRLSDYAGG
jgi:cytoskeletal protein RodZ